jgi:predicted lipid-binding transport protein (Tim44 family)
VRYAIQCTPGGLLRDDRSGNVITYASHEDAATEAWELSRDARSKGRGWEFKPIPLPAKYDQ